MLQLLQELKHQDVYGKSYLSNMLLFVVEQVFTITGRGVVLLPGFGQRIIRIGTPILLVRPNGSTFQTHIRGIGFNEFHDILIGENIQKEDVPVGTQVWVDDELVVLDR